MNNILLIVVLILGFQLLMITAYGNKSPEFRKRLIETVKKVDLIEKGAMVVTSPNGKRIADYITKKEKAKK